MNSSFGKINPLKHNEREETREEDLSSTARAKGGGIVFHPKKEHKTEKRGAAIGGLSMAAEEESRPFLPGEAKDEEKGGQRQSRRRRLGTSAGRERKILRRIRSCKLVSNGRGGNEKPRQGVKKLRE